LDISPPSDGFLSFGESRSRKVSGNIIIWVTCPLGSVRGSLAQRVYGNIPYIIFSDGAKEAGEAKETSKELPKQCGGALQILMAGRFHPDSAEVPFHDLGASREAETCAGKLVSVMQPPEGREDLIPTVTNGSRAISSLPAGQCEP